jgi:hypothetical protein
MKKVLQILPGLSALFLFSLAIAGCKSENRRSVDFDPDSSLVLVIQIPVVRLPSVLVESSGLAMTTPGKVWSHNDSGNESKLYSVGIDGTLLRTITVSNANNVDWEELAMDNQKRLYICDVGNNYNNRTDQTIYRIPDPESFDENVVTAEIIRFSYEDQTSFPPVPSAWNYDLEAVIWHSDSLFMFTKDRTTPFAGYTKMYKIPATPGTHVAKLAGSRYLGNTISSVRVTAADIHPATGKLVLLVNNRLIVFSNYPGNRFLEGKVTEYSFNKMPGQVEAIIFQSESKLYMTEEGIGSTPGFLYEITLPVK